MNLFTTAQIEAIKDAERMLINVRQTLSTAKDEVLNSLSSDDIDNINKARTEDRVGLTFGPQVAHGILERMNDGISEALGECMAARTYS